jgi:glycosyltransferase involved in cell wall biosynthesis
LYRLLRQFPHDRYGLISTTRYNQCAPTPEQDGPWLNARYIHVDLGFPLRRITDRRGAAHLPRELYTLANLTVALYRRARAIGTAVRERNYRAIVACSGDPIDLPASAIAAHRLGVRFLAYMFDDYGTQYRMLPAHQHFSSVCDYLVARRAERIIVSNEMLAMEYASRHHVQPAIIHNPHTGVYGAGEDRPLPAEGIRIVYTGSVYHVHHDAFVRLIQVVERSDRQFLLDLYGSVDTNLKPMFQGSRCVRYYGHVADAEAQRLQTEADLLFLPLAFNCPAPEVVRTALPGKFAEYLASGRPMLVHAPPDSFVAWYCRRHQCAVVVDKADPRELAGGLERLATDAEFRCAIVARALDRARKDFDPAIAQRNFFAVVADNA